MILLSFAGSPFQVVNSRSNSVEINTSTSAPTPTPYAGPVLQTPGLLTAVPQGSKVTIPGSNLSGISKVEIGRLDAGAVLNSSGELEITIPSNLAAGTYDLVVTSDSGKLTVQDGIRVSAGLGSTETAAARASTKLDQASQTVKVRVFDVVGAGKVQILFNGKELVWLSADSASGPKLHTANGMTYLVRTLKLVSGQKNVIEIYVNDERVRRNAYAG